MAKTLVDSKLNRVHVQQL